MNARDESRADDDIEDFPELGIGKSLEGKTIEQNAQVQPIVW